ncbi:hypothetical protein [Streptomyces litchfieldiae]|uniref:Glycosyltransferase n=1 Tax=Streptomyces litchfieldiae TaxID=3075543 RepID=A0ABU2MTG5_9ACTN|nr:hypothetical protein [Streptomyces sp. DSM 44938]MDT0344927.1 hypothetical protein [Streptomyces sp. DSM 44938]
MTRQTADTGHRAAGRDSGTALRGVTVVCHQYPPWSLGGPAEYTERFVHRALGDHPGLAPTPHTLNGRGDLPHRERHGDLTIRRHRLPRGLKRRVVAPRDHTSAAGRAAVGLALLLFDAATFATLCRARRRAGLALCRRALAGGWRR